MSEAKVLTRREGRVLHVTINRPERMNAIDTETNFALQAAFDEFATDGELWVAVIRGAGDKAFSAGGDLKAMNAASSGGPAYVVPEKGYAGLTSRFDLDKPVIAAVNGLAMGGGFEIVMAADLAVAAEHAVFSLPEPLAGIVAYAAGMHRLPRQLPHKQAMELLLTCETLTAAQAMEWGLINQVVPAVGLDAAVDKLVQKVLRCAPLAVRATKQCVQRGLNLSLEDAVRGQETGLYPALEAMRQSQDILEGIRAFAEKRSPVWTGR
ncbi:MAG: enoyl-CoA hydratase/isomerase family protein [Proteobacteria bacterium]|nr:enoyl-CoA hydratase/isomerase family protein [Pseudomonadota bacterium]HQR02788.1 enoyl-CoA hydratase-related protein [Rhodocyclaceae bacterium]